MSVFKEHYKKHNLSIPSYHFVLGSGFSPAVDIIFKKFSQSWEEKQALSFKDVPQIPTPTALSHTGVFRYFLHKDTGRSLILQCGRVHLYEGHSAQTVVQPVVQSRLAGTKNFIITNISGGLKLDHKVGTVIALKDHFNHTGKSPLVGQNYQTEMEGLDYFPDMSQIYQPALTDQIMSCMQDLKLDVRKGIYVGALGPELENPTYIEWLNRSSQGLFDCVGMSTVLEAVALKHMRACISGFSLVSNPAAGVNPAYKELSGSDIIGSAKQYAQPILESFFNFSEKQFKKT